MNRKLYVYIDLDGAPRLIGQLWTRAKGKQETASFQYDEGWLKSPTAFALGPTLPLGKAPLHSPRPLFNAFADTAPDSWGRKLMRLHEREAAKKEGREAKTLLQVDYLASVDDETRMGALRFKNDPSNKTFLNTGEHRVPPLIRLRELLSASSRVVAERETPKDVALLMAPGTALGGARPKATVRDGDERLFLAKFPKRDDEWPWTLWEAVTLTLARDAGVTVSEHRIETIARKPVLMIARFDRRAGGLRVPFLSALTALDATDNEQGRSYLEILDFLRQEGAKPEEDARQLWRRMVFNVLVSNTDDHLRNHGFLRVVDGWRLSPAYDLNPAPQSVREHSLALNELDSAASLDTLFSVIPSFGIKLAEAESIVSDVVASVTKWREVAARFDLSKADQQFMEPAFMHVDLEKAIALRSRPSAPARLPPKPTKRSRKKAQPAPRESNCS